VVIRKELCDKLTDEQLVAYCHSDIDYFLCIYERYEPRLLRYIRRITHVSTEQAEDILQEAFIKIWQNLNGFDPKLKLSSWIYRIVHNETISHWRKNRSFNKNRKVKLEENVLHENPDDPSLFENLNEKEKRVYELLDQLPLPYKTILWLKFIEEMSYQEISDVLKIPEGTVATRINRAKKRFSQLTTDNNIHF
jgi:RNA polymerase sigma-70 factor (ECF subfamily)